MSGNDCISRIWTSYANTPVYSKLMGMAPRFVNIDNIINLHKPDMQYAPSKKPSNSPIVPLTLAQAKAITRNLSNREIEIIMNRLDNK